MARPGEAHGVGVGGTGVGVGATHGSWNAPEAVAEHPAEFVTVTSPTETRVPPGAPAGQAGGVKPETEAVI